IRRVGVRISDALEVVLVVVGVLGHVLGRVGDRSEPVSVVVSIRRLLPILVCYRSTTASSVISKHSCGLIWVGDCGKPVAIVVRKVGLVLHGVDDLRAVAMSIVVIGCGVGLHVGDGMNQPSGIVSQCSWMV